MFMVERILVNVSLARTTGLEPATTGSTVRYSNQLSYVPKVLLIQLFCAFRFIRFSV